MLTTLITHCFSLLCYYRIVYYASPLLFFHCLSCFCIFCFDLQRSLSATLTEQLMTHHTILPANSTAASTIPLLLPSCLFAHAPFISTVIFFFRLFFSPATLNSIQVLQPSRCALSTSALFFILFILLHSLIWSIHTTLTFSVSLKFGSNPLQPLLNSWTALLNITPWSALPVMAPARSHPLAVAQVSLCANLSHSYPHLLLISHHVNHLLSLCNFLIQIFPPEQQFPWTKQRRPEPWSTVYAPTTQWPLVWGMSDCLDSQTFSSCRWISDDVEGSPTFSPVYCAETCSFWHKAILFSRRFWMPLQIPYIHW